MADCDCGDCSCDGCDCDGCDCDCDCDCCCCIEDCCSGENNVILCCCFFPTHNDSARRGNRGGATNTNTTTPTDCATCCCCCCSSPSHSPERSERSKKKQSKCFCSRFCSWFIGRNKPSPPSSSYSSPRAQPQSENLPPISVGHNDNRYPMDNMERRTGKQTSLEELNMSRKDYKMDGKWSRPERYGERYQRQFQS